MVIIDTDILVDLLRMHTGAQNWFASLSYVPAISGISLMEAIQGCRNAQEARNLLRFSAPFQISWPTEADCQRALAYFSTFYLSHGVGLLDTLIGACASGRDAVLYTFNIRHYNIIPDIRVEQPYYR